MSKLQQEVSKIKTDTDKKGKKPVEDRRVLEQVTNLQSALDKAHVCHEQQKTKGQLTEKQREASARREAQLRSRVDALKVKLDKAEKSVQIQERKACLPDIYASNCKPFAQMSELAASEFQVSLHADG